MSQAILHQAENCVAELFNTKLPEGHFYHNMIHTRMVVAFASEIAKGEHFSEKEQLLLLLAAWFHDVGHIEKNKGHEEISASIAQNFLIEKEFDAESIAIVKRLILCTQVGVEPTDELEKALKDADCGHLAQPNYITISERLREELACQCEQDISENDWFVQNITFLKNHKYYTAYAVENWQPKKEENQLKVAQKLAKMNAKKKAKKDSEAKIKMGRGVETLFRVQLKNHIQLSAIADTKANILLSVNAIIISVALSNLIPKLDSPSNMYLVVPTFILMVFSVASVVLSVLSTRPKISNVKVTQDMIKQKKTNILFFGNFYKMTLDEFDWGINYLINNEDVLYNSLTKDLYYLGLVLERKYRLLRITYTVFMVGIIVSAIAFVFSYYHSIIQHH